MECAIISIPDSLAARRPGIRLNVPALCVLFGGRSSWPVHDPEAASHLTGTWQVRSQSLSHPCMHKYGYHFYMLANYPAQTQQLGVARMHDAKLPCGSQILMQRLHHVPV